MNLVISWFIFATFLLSCNSQSKNGGKNTEISEDRESFEDRMILSHKAFLKKEKNRIDHFVDSSNLSFKESGTGLRYAVIKENKNGEQFKTGDIAIISYTLTTLQGDTLYESPTNPKQEFMVDFDQVESGLHEGIKYVRVGEDVIFILPAHLGHGITGDQAAIPSQTTLVYYLTILGKK